MEDQHDFGSFPCFSQDAETVSRKRFQKFHIAPRNFRILIPDLYYLLIIMIYGISFLFLLFQAVKLHLHIVHIRRSVTHALCVRILAPVHGSALVLILSGTLHAKFFSIIQEGRAAHEQVHRTCKLRLLL